MVVIPSMSGTLPDGLTTVYAIVVIPEDNLLNKSEAWLNWEQNYPTRYRLRYRKERP